MNWYDRLAKCSNKFVNIASLMHFASEDNKKVINLQDFKKKKEIEERNKKYGLTSLFELMDPNVLFGENSTINVDDMHRARKAAGFPQVPQDAPAWMHMVVAAIDEENPAKRKAKFTRLSHWFAKGTKDPEEKKKAQEEYEKEKAEEERRFLKAAKQGWLKFSNIQDWADNYPLLFSNLGYLINDWESAAKEYLIARNQVLKARERRQNIVPHDINVTTLPIGTTLYFAKPLQKLFKKWITKIDKDEWISDEKTIGSDAFVIARLKNNFDSEFPTLLWKPDETFDSSEYVPTEIEINSTIERYLRENPEKFLQGYGWKYDAGSVYSDSDDEIDD